MSKLEKLKSSFLQSRKTFSWFELVSLLRLLGYEKREMEGSRIRFYHKELAHTIMIHRPHPENYIKGATIKAVKETLQEVNLL